MKFNLFLLISIFFSFAAFSQIEQDTTAFGYVLKETDTISKPIELPELLVLRDNRSPEDRKEWLLLQNRVYKVYPYAKIASERLLSLNKNMDALQTNREKKRYLKIVENYMETEFEGQLKKLSRKQGQILVKLIYRQTGKTTFTLIKELKSGWKAFWYNNTGKVFDISIKAKYEPYVVNEDFFIETILDRAFESGRLVSQAAVNPIDIDELTEFWTQKAQKKN